MSVLLTINFIWIKSSFLQVWVSFKTSTKLSFFPVKTTVLVLEWNCKNFFFITEIQEVQNLRNYVPKVCSFVLFLGPTLDKRAVNLYTENDVYFLYIFGYLSLDEIFDPLLQNCTNTISGNVHPSCAA
jgi:hypothetical protein